MSYTHPEIHHQEDAEYGLLLPNGIKIWPPDVFHEMALTTAESRNNIVESLKTAALNIGKDVDKFLAEFKWLLRYRRTTVIVEWGGDVDIPFDDPSVIAVPEPETPEVETPVAAAAAAEDAVEFVAEDQRGPTPEYYLPPSNGESEGGGRHSV